jgi:two-component system, OmpR family, KDP operon response regulator KdpE
MGMPTRLQGLSQFEIGDRQIDLEAHIIRCGGDQVSLTQIECRLLQRLGSQLNKTISSEKLVSYLWGSDCKRGTHSLRSVIKNVRRKLEPDPGHPRYLVLDRTFGYQLRAQ